MEQGCGETGFAHASARGRVRAQPARRRVWEGAARPQEGVGGRSPSFFIPLVCGVRRMDG